MIQAVCEGQRDCGDEPKEAGTKVGDVFEREHRKSSVLTKRGQHMRGWILGAAWLSLALMGACRQESTQAIGEVQKCGNGMYFSLQDQACRPLKGYNFQLDAFGFERVKLSNGVSVPRKVNGKSPFIVSFAYNVTQAASFDVVVKRYEFGNVKDENYTYWEKVKVPAGQGEAKVRLFPKDGLIPPGGPAQRVEDQWQEDEGYIIEIKGGDRFENEDSDELSEWRVAGLDVDPSAPDDPDGKVLIMEPISLSASLQSCTTAHFYLEFRKSEIDLAFSIALKEPANAQEAWYSWGTVEIKVPAGSAQKIPVELVLKDRKGLCPPAGRAVNTSNWDAVPGAYVLQIDVFDKSGKKLNLSTSEYQAGPTTLGVNILPAEPLGTLGSSLGSLAHPEQRSPGTEEAKP